ncbi:hypothetical protein GE21DRAFT_6521 [Neurospora crassa]|uniref:Uncharacterized protein n=1 Tax=Neurospora crassa (strain ATCC 24698 / 74-OR23-1A / CBS 708.71 / DSM 1257 / FGSC 987) TaxID=367110 RepID=Q7S9A8_NEUCR|nr:hypothetical protein NCU07028 [Neurospora crassa OR74A]EAA32931.3 hypothetical protein NCU07028 [Neurospora crassa OR74A]KHE80944.1 hypothetical protein GE21DRAFT_6521 [Neurospora crassa]|eukprot:XP_962167.3 hypothetical protein NCU07028 [Neurospora crassa OR74A]
MFGEVGELGKVDVGGHVSSRLRSVEYGTWSMLQYLNPYFRKKRKGPAGTGELFRYGDADTAGTVDLTTVLETPTFSRRCGSNEIKCFSENQAAASSCMTLIDGLLATRNNFPNSPRCVRQLGRQLVACLGAVDGEVSGKDGAIFDEFARACEEMDGKIKE